MEGFPHIGHFKDRSPNPGVLRRKCAAETVKLAYRDWLNQWDHAIFIHPAKGPPPDSAADKEQHILTTQPITTLWLPAAVGLWRYGVVFAFWWRPAVLMSVLTRIRGWGRRGTWQYCTHGSRTCVGRHTCFCKGVESQLICHVCIEICI